MEMWGESAPLAAIRHDMSVATGVGSCRTSQWQTALSRQRLHAPCLLSCGLTGLSTSLLQFSHFTAFIQRDTLGSGGVGGGRIQIIGSGKFGAPRSLGMNQVSPTDGSLGCLLKRCRWATSRRERAAACRGLKSEVMTDPSFQINVSTNVCPLRCIKQVALKRLYH